MTLTKDSIKAASDRPTITVDVPEWNGSVFVGKMTGRQRAQYEDALDGPYELLRATVVALCVVDEAGQRVFADADIGWLNDKSAAALDVISKAALAHNRLRKQDKDTAEKNSGAADSAASSTASPDTSPAPLMNSLNESAPTS